MSSTDWEKCALCQQDSNQPLQCQAQLTRSDIGIGTGYEALVVNLEKFIELNDLPMDINVNRLNDGSGILSTLKKNKAKWHKLCKIK